MITFSCNNCNSIFCPDNNIKITELKCDKCGTKIISRNISGSLNISNEGITFKTSREDLNAEID